MIEFAYAATSGTANHIAMFFAFFFLYHTYIQDIIYEERLNQMEEITRQMFQNLEDVIDSHWDRVTEECNYLRDANIQTTDEPVSYTHLSRSLFFLYLLQNKCIPESFYI